MRDDRRSLIVGNLPEETVAALTPRSSTPYQVQRTPRGSVVICAAHVVTNEVKDEEARALATALNHEYQRRHSA